MLKVGTIVSIISSPDPWNGIVVDDVDTIYNAADTSMVLITSSGEYHGKVFPFQKYQLEVISESS